LMNDVPVLVDVHEHAVMLGVSESTVWRNHGKNGWPAGRYIGGQVRWDEAEIRAYAQNGGTR
jgi:predicted DNA-binding transcriptional regulator AlpA